MEKEDYNDYTKEELLNILEKQQIRIEVLEQMLKQQTDSLQKWNDKTIELIGTIVEFRDLESGNHIKRVKKYSEIIARQVQKSFPEYGLTNEEVHIIVVASPLHDIGKIAIPDSILLKPGKLTEDEFDYMKSHTLSGKEVLEKVKDIWPEKYRKIAMEISCFHHERYDGKGYPYGLIGNQIPLSAQIVSLADVYDALVHERIYKDAIPRDRAFRMIIHGECGAFNPELLKCMELCKEALEQNI